MFDILINSSKSNWHTNNSGPRPCVGEEGTEMCMWLERPLPVPPPSPSPQALICNIKWTWNFLCKTNLTLGRKTFNFKGRSKDQRENGCVQRTTASECCCCWNPNHGLKSRQSKRPPQRATHAWKEAELPHVDARKPWDQKCIIWIILVALERAEWGEQV